MELSVGNEESLTGMSDALPGTGPDVALNEASFTENDDLVQADVSDGVSRVYRSTRLRSW